MTIRLAKPNMKDSIYLDTTYLKLLRSDTKLWQVLDRSFDGKLDEILQNDYIYGDAILAIFQTFADQGLDSWLLRFGQHLSVGTHGPLGFTVLSAPDLRTAIDVLAEFIAVRTSAYKCFSARQGNRIAFITEDQTEHTLIGQWMREASLRVAQELIEAVMAHPLGDMARISFTHARPDYYIELERFYGIPVEYNANENAISIPASWLLISSPLSAPDTFRTNLNKCRELKLKLTDQNDLISATKIALNSFFEARILGRARSHDMPSLKTLAAKHHCSARTFSRRLNDKKQSYKSLLEGCRRHHAVDLLSNTHSSIAEISLQLNYQEPANFVRAFKMWFDTPPATWRRKLAKTDRPAKIRR
ncbi:MAG: AraC-like DNA-binding protein [Arenicella sp.]|jgi:AraC-like DNA-binding protein